MNTGHAWQGAEDDAAEDACSVFLAHHSAYLDDELTASERAVHEGHEATCAACARYARVLERGTAVLRAEPDLEPSPEFELRLQHRIFHLQDEAVLGRQGRVSGWFLAAALLAGAMIAPRAWQALTDRGDVAPASAGVLPAFELPPSAHPHEAVFGARRELFSSADVPIAMAGPAATLESGFTPVVIQPPQLRASGAGVGAE